MITKNKIAEESEELGEKQLVLAVGLHDSWFENITYLLTCGQCPEGLTTRKRRNIKLKVAMYVIWHGKLF